MHPEVFSVFKDSYMVEFLDLPVEPSAAVAVGAGQHFEEVARRVEGFAGDIRLIAPSRREGLPRPGTVEVLLSTR